MNRDIDLFVQAFWAKCREVIRPEIDTRIDDLRRAGHDAHVSTQEFSEVADQLPAPAGPSLTLAIRPEAARAAHHAIEFHGDVQRQTVEVMTGGGAVHSYELAALGTTEVKAEIESWVAQLATRPPV